MTGILLEEFIYGLVVDEDLSEVFINSAGSTFGLVKSTNKMIQCKSPFSNELELIDALQVLAHSQAGRLDARLPFAGGSLWNGRGRWHAVIPPASDVAIAAFRCLSHNPLKIDDICASSKIRQAVINALEGERAILIFGDTGAGKTTVLATLLRTRCSDERVCVVESYPEIPLSSERWFRLNACPPKLDGKGEVSLATCLEQALRLRPDRIVQGEIRGAEIKNFLKISTLGHRAPLATVHGQGLADFQVRLALEMKAVPDINLVGLYVDRKKHLVTRVSSCVSSRIAEIRAG